MLRIRGTAGAVPLVVSYDKNESVYNPPMPLLFQAASRLENRPVGETRHRAVTSTTRSPRPGSKTQRPPAALHLPRLQAALHHRRDPARDAAAHRPARRRAPRHQHHHGLQGRLPRGSPRPTGRSSPAAASRPGEEYRIPTDEEWAEFLGHFERRGRPRRLRPRLRHPLHPRARLPPLPALRPTPPRRPASPRSATTSARIAEAEREGWPGEAEGLKSASPAPERSSPR